MTDESALHLKCIEAVKDGKLPSRRADRVWAGPGEGSGCTICGEPVKPEDRGIELEFQRDDFQFDNYPLHDACFRAWEYACQRLGPVPDHSIQPLGPLGGGRAHAEDARGSS